jgi:TolA-binding protein
MLFQNILYAVLLAIGPTQNEPRVSARVSNSTPNVGETFLLEVIVQAATDDADIRAPRIPPGLDIVGTQDYSETQFTIPGGRHQTRRREFALLAAAPGRFRIPPIDVVIGRRSYRTNAVEVVVSGSPQPRTLTSTNEAWLHATMRPETVYVGQQSTLIVEAGFSDEVRVRLTRPPVYDTPSPTGFWVQDIPAGISSQLRSLNGRIVEVQTLQRAYFPLSAGKYAFAPARAIIDVREGFLFAPETREIRSPSPKLVVLSLPENGKPADFRGAVGSYTIRASVQPDTVAVGEAAQISVELIGTGNVKALPQPLLPSLPGIEQFAPTEDATVSFDGASAQGTKRFQWVIIPEHTGKLQIPAITYSYFDPYSRSYKQLSTMPLTLLAIASRTTEAETATGTALQAVRTKPRHVGLWWTRSTEFWLLQIIPLLAILVAFLATYMRRGRSPATLVIARLHALRAAELPYMQFLKELESIIQEAIQLRSTDAAVPSAQILIQRIETQRFAPAAAETQERTSLIGEAQRVVHALLEPPRRASKAYQSVLFVAVLAVPQSMHDSGAFEQGLQHYRSGQFAQAAKEFEASVRSDSTNVAAWFNMGNAYFRSGDRGRAVWAWAHAGRQAPRDRAVTRTLQSVGAVEVLRTRPPLSVRPVEWYLLAAICWWVACALCALAILKRTRLPLQWALPFLIMAIVALAIGMSADRKHYAVALDADTQLYGDPTVHSPVVVKVQAGAGLDVLEQRDQWLRVRTLTQAEGWVESEAVGRL